MSDKDISLYYHYNKNGPGKVIENLSKGLELNSYTVHLNPNTPKGWIGLLQDHPIWNKLKKNEALCGPNLFVLPIENINLCNKFNHFVCPSKWIYDKYRNYKILDHATIDIWPVGIDTEKWQSKRPNENKIKNVLLYTKGKNNFDIKKAIEIIKKADCDVEHLQYGYYSEHELYSLCSNVDCCVLLTGTESQGIAYMQILSCGIPCYVVDTKIWKNDTHGAFFDATSVPYFDERCGIKTDYLEENIFLEFLTNLDKFNPRAYILENHALDISAMNYVQILKKYDCKFW